MKHGEKLCIDHCPRCGCESAPRVDWEYDEMHGRNWIFEHYTCPECGKEAVYWGVESGEDDTLLDTLHCEKCGFTWERVYKYAWSRRVED